MQKQHITFLLTTVLFAAFTTFPQKSSAQTVSAGISLSGLGTLKTSYYKSDTLGHTYPNYYISAELPFVLLLKKQAFTAVALKLGNNFSIRSWQKWLPEIRAELSVAYQNQLLGRFIPVDMHISIVPAYRFKHSYVGLRMGLTQNLFTHINHSKYVAQRYSGLLDSDGKPIHRSPDNGFYAFTSTQLMVGLASKFKINARSSISLDLGLLHRPNSLAGITSGTKYGLLPAYLHLSYYHSFK